VYFRVISVGIVITLKYLKEMGARGGWIQPVHDRDQCQDRCERGNESRVPTAGNVSLMQVTTLYK
jgi:hypothetical protein